MMTGYICLVVLIGKKRKYFLGEGWHMEKTEGIYTYRCGSCLSVFGIVTRLSVLGDCIESVRCPKPGCNGAAGVFGEGYIKYTAYKETEKTDKNIDVESYSEYPLILDVGHLVDILRISKRAAYELMKRADFPAMRIKRRRLVEKDDFLNWLSTQKF